MIALIASLSVQPDKVEPFEARFLKLVAAVKANEPGNRMYQLVRSAETAGAYRVLEVYDDQAAVDLHRRSDHFKAVGPDLRAFMAGPLQVEQFETVD